MRTLAVQALLAIAVLTAWLGAAALARLGRPLDRLHCVTFVNVGCGALLLIAAGFCGGSADDVIKVAVLIGSLLFGGAAVAHATARAIVRRRTQT